MRAYAPQILTWTAADTATKYIRLHEGTDRHQIHVGFSVPGVAFAVAVAAPQPTTTGEIPEPSGVAAMDWITLTFAPATNGRLVLTCVGRYVRLIPGGGGPGADVSVSYLPLPPTSC